MYLNVFGCNVVVHPRKKLYGESLISTHRCKLRWRLGIAKTRCCHVAPNCPQIPQEHCWLFYALLSFMFHHGNGNGMVSQLAVLGYLWPVFFWGCCGRPTACANWYFRMLFMHLNIYICQFLCNVAVRWGCVFLMWSLLLEATIISPSLIEMGLLFDVGCWGACAAWLFHFIQTFSTHFISFPIQLHWCRMAILVDFVCSLPDLNFAAWSDKASSSELLFFEIYSGSIRSLGNAKPQVFRSRFSHVFSPNSWPRIWHGSGHRSYVPAQCHPFLGVRHPGEDRTSTANPALMRNAEWKHWRWVTEVGQDSRPSFVW